MVRQVRICGFGGQGVVLAGVILGEAAVLDGKWAAGASSYGAQARGGYARSDLVISDRPIVYPRVMEADLLVAMAQSAYDRYSTELAQGALGGPGGPERGGLEGGPPSRDRGKERGLR